MTRNLRTTIIAPLLSCWLLALLCIGSNLGAPCISEAQTDIFIRGAGRLIPIAVPQLCLESGDATVARDIPRIIGRDLDLSGFFEVLDPGGYVETPGKCGGPESVAFSDWSVIGAEGLVRGVVSANPGGGVRVQMYLYDVQKQRPVLGKEYHGEIAQVPQMAHRFANEIMKFFTGEYGPFGTQIAFSSKIGRFKELFVMDMDGSNIRQLSNERALALAPAWDQAGQRLIYTSYRNRIPDLFVLGVADRATRQVSRDDALEIGAQFLPDGKIIFSRSAGRDSDIVIGELQSVAKSGAIRKLTRSDGAINVSPVLSPNGDRIAFCSNRAGGPQIYTMGLDGSDVKRVSFTNSNYCTSPAWSPKGDRMAYVCRAEGKFQLFVSEINGGNAVQLTSTGDNEEPDWSPDGRYLVFASTAFSKGVFNLALLKVDGGAPRQLTTSKGGDSQPAWGPRSN